MGAGTGIVGDGTGGDSATREDNTDVWIGDHCINAQDVLAVQLSIARCGRRVLR